MYFRLMATIFDLPVTPTLKSFHTSPTVLLKPEMVGLTSLILLPTTIQDLQFECFWYPVEHGWFLAWCDVSSSIDFSVLKFGKGTLHSFP